MLNPAVKDFLNSVDIWTLSTVGKNGPHAVPLRFHTVLEDGTLVIARMFLDASVENIEANSKVCVTAGAMPENGMPQGFRVEGTAKVVTEGPLAETFAGHLNFLRSKGLPAIGGVVVVTPEKVVNVAPGPHLRQVM